MSEPQKTTYRVYCYDAVLKNVEVDSIEAGSDEEAIAIATAAGFCTKTEIWDGRRLVAQLDGERRQA
jgi:hypothetical protein